MAFIQNNQNEEDKDKQGTQPGQSTGSSGIISSGSTPSAPKVGSNKTQSFATLQSYLKPNKVQGEALAGQIAQNTAQVGQDAQAKIEGAAANVGSQIKANTITPDANLVNEAKANPTAFVKDPSKLDAFTKQRTAQYGGPTNVAGTADFQDATNTVNAAKQKEALLDSESGRKELLGDVQQNKATGVTALNQALLSTNPNAVETLQGAKGAFSNLEGMLTGKTAELNAQAEAGKKAADDARTAATTALDPLVPQLNEKLGKASQEAIASRDKYNADIANTKTWLNKVMPITGNFNPRLNDSLQPLAQMQPEANVPTVGNVASPDDYAYEQALERLTGKDLGILQNDQSAQAGSYKTPEMKMPIPMDENTVNALASTPMTVLGGGGKTITLTPDQARQKILVDNILSQAVDELWSSYPKSAGRASIPAIETKTGPNGEELQPNGRPWTPSAKFYALINKMDWQAVDGGSYGAANAQLDRMRTLLSQLAKVMPGSVAVRTAGVPQQPGKTQEVFDWQSAPGTVRSADGKLIY